MCKIVKVFLILTILSCVKGRPIFSTDGNFTLIGLISYRGTVPGKSKCSVVRPSDGLLLAIAMKNAVERVNKDLSILPNIKIGLRIYDICEEALLQNIILNMVWTPNFAGVIGPTNCEDTSTVGVSMSLFHIPMITFNEVPLRIDYRRYFEVQYWAVPAIIHSVHALRDFICRMNWNFIGLLYQNNDYGWAVTQNALSHDHGWPICFYNMVVKDVGTSAREYSLAFFEHFIMGDQRVKVIALFLEEAELAKFVKGLELLHEDVVSQYTFLALSKWGTKQVPVLRKGNQKYAHGVITFQPFYKMDEEFEAYFHSENFRKEPLVKNYTRSICRELQNHTNAQSCKLNTGDLEKTFGDIKHSKVSAVVNSVFAFASWFHYLAAHNQTKLTAQNRRWANSIMRNMTTSAGFTYPFRKDLFAFQKNRRVLLDIRIYNYQRISDTEYAYKKIGDWRLASPRSREYNNNSSIYYGAINLVPWTEIQWGMGENKPPSSTCSTQCTANQVRKVISRFEKCCNTCETCGAEEVIVNNTCKPCSIDEHPNKNLTSCEKLTLQMVHVTKRLVYITITFSCLGILATLTAVGIFLYYRHEHIVKASSRELSGFIFLGVLIMCFVPVLALYEVTPVVCFFERLMLYIGFTFIYAPLFLKTNRVFRIFQAAHSSTAPPKVVSPMSQVLITLFFCAVQVLLCIPRISVIKIGYLYPTHKQFVEVYCNDDFLVFSINVTYVVFLMGATTFYAFKTRHFPKNYNESKYIGFTMYITCFICAIGLVAYFLVLNKGMKSIVLSWTCLLCAYVVLFGLFTHKLYCVYKTQRDKTKAEDDEETKTQNSNLDFDVTSVATDSPRLWYLRRLSKLSILKKPASYSSTTKNVTSTKENDYDEPRQEEPPESEL